MWSIGEFQRRRARANRPLGRRIDFFNGLIARELDDARREELPLSSSLLVLVEDVVVRAAG